METNGFWMNNYSIDGPIPSKGVWDNEQMSQQISVDFSRRKRSKKGLPILQQWLICQGQVVLVHKCSLLDV